MQSRILVKPNLKLILLGALLIAVLHDVFTSGKSESFRNHPYRVTWLSDEELDELLEEVASAPNYAGYMLISEAYEKRGDIRKAMYYMRKADVIGRLEDSEE